MPLADNLALEYDSGRRRTALTNASRGLLYSDDVSDWRYFDDDPTCSLGPP